MNIEEIRAKYPQYAEVDDATLAKGLHKKFYADMAFNDFSTKIGLALQGKPYEGGLAADIRRAAVPVVQGLTLGWGDELVEAFGSPQQAADYRATLASQKESHPVASIMGEIAPSLISGAGIAKGIVSAAPKIAPWVQAGLAGATEGAVGGAGFAEEGDKLAGAGLGAVGGSVLGAGGQLVGQAAPHVGSAVKRAIMRTPGGDAKQIVGQAMHADQIAGKNVQGLLDEFGPSGAVVDLGPNLQSLGGQVYRGSPAGKRIGSEFLDERQGLLSARAGELAESVAPEGQASDFGTRDFNEYLLSVADTQRRRAAPYYDAAYASRITPSETLTDLLENTPAGKQAARRGQTALANEADPTVRTDTKADDGTYSLRYLDQVKRSLDDNIGVAQRVGRKNDARKLQEIKSTLVREVDQAVPDYATARRTFAGYAGMQDAAEEGRKLLSGTKDFATDMQAKVGAFNESEREAFKVGVARSIQDLVERAPDNADAARRVIRSPQLQDKLRLALGDEEAGRLIGELEKLSAMKQTDSVIRAGSQTAERLTGDEMVVENFADRGLMRSVLDMVSPRRPSITDAETAEEVAGLLFSPAARSRLAGIRMPEQATPGLSKLGGLLGLGSAGAVGPLLGDGF